VSSTTTIPAHKEGNTQKTLPRRVWWQLASSRIAIGFVIWSAVWVVLSDFVLHTAIHGSTKELWALETVKGLVYVGVTGIALYAFARAREKEYFAARRTTENRLRRLTECNLISICYWRSNGEITDANDAFLKLLGYTRAELLDRRINWHDFTPPEYHARDSENLERVTADGRHIAYEKELIRKDGTRVSVLVGAALLDSSSRRGIAYALDMTELKNAQQRTTELEQQLRQSQKLEAVGQLASGIAHDFNNLLNIIVGYTSLIDTKYGTDEYLQDQLKHVLKAAEKASSLVRRLLAFGRKQLLNPELLNINLVLREYEQIMPRLIGEKVRFELDLCESPGLVEVDRNQLEQVIVNLAVNARDAMPFGGKLTVKTENRDTSGDVCMIVSDTGIGMSEQTMARMFDPFFTTKPEGVGTGLGLSTVYGIITQSGGHITASSELGKGTVFTIAFPRAWEPRKSVQSVMNAPQPSRAISRSNAKSATILLAEDEPDLRDLLSSMLRMHGYQVLPAQDGESALVIAKSHRGSIELLVTDIVMPNMNGVEAAQKIRSVRPEVKVIYMTGYAEEAFLLTKSSTQEILLEKPVPPAVLVGKIKELLDMNNQRRFA
jgi:two-component system cell cycle sensor histidine kinase/response regulator CckA